MLHETLINTALKSVLFHTETGPQWKAHISTLHIDRHADKVVKHKYITSVTCQHLFYLCPSSCTRSSNGPLLHPAPKQNHRTSFYARFSAGWHREFSCLSLNARWYTTTLTDGHADRWRLSYDVAVLFARWLLWTLLSSGTWRSVVW